MSDLLIKKTEGQLLDAFVGALRDFLGCDRWEERESVNYVEARYFRCSVLGPEVRVAIADSAEFKDYDFWLYFEPDASCRGCEAFLDGLADCVARKIAAHGYEVIRPFDFGRVSPIDSAVFMCSESAFRRLEGDPTVSGLRD